MPTPIEKTNNNWGRIGGYLGGVIGTCGASIGFIAVCTWTKHFDVVLSLGIPFFLVSLALGLTICLAIDGVTRAANSPGWQMAAIWGSALVVTGLLLLISRTWLEPEMMRHGDLRQFAYSQSPGLSKISASLAGGTLLLLPVFLKVLRTPLPLHSVASKPTIKIDD